MNNKVVGLVYFLIITLIIAGCNSSDGAKLSSNTTKTSKKSDTNRNKSIVKVDTPKPATLDTNLYKKLVSHLVHDSASKKWPVKSEYPLPGAILPFKRIIAYYGNFYTPNMGILGMQPEDTMLVKLAAEVKKWKEADSLIPTLPAIHYIAVTAQGKPGKNSKYRMRMPPAQIEHALALAKKINGIVFLDVQVGWSSVQDEIPLLETYLKQPNVHLGIDPEFSMKESGRAPGTIIGTYDAADINYVTEYLAKLVKENKLPPKVFIVHRFTKGMVTNYKDIILRPGVQIVMDMDGWGFPAKKVSSYVLAEANEPVQFTGFKLFYKNDILTPPWKTVMKPADVLKLYPSPIYIQYQ